MINRNYLYIYSRDRLYQSIDNTELWAYIVFDIWRVVFLKFKDFFTIFIN